MDFGLKTSYQSIDDSIDVVFEQDVKALLSTQIQFK